MRVTPAEEYHVFDVLCPDTICSRGFLWGITENDSLLYSVFSRPELESCSWKIFHYHQGCMMHTDSTYQLHIGAYDTLSSPFPPQRVCLYTRGYAVAEYTRIPNLSGSEIRNHIG